MAIWLLLSEQRRTQFKPIKRRLFVERVAKNNKGNNGSSNQEITKIFLIDCLVLVIISVCKTVHSSEIAQFTASLLDKILQLIVSG